MLLLIIWSVEPPRLPCIKDILKTSRIALRPARLLILVSATLHNITVDDTDSHIAYSPPSSWHSSSDPCSTCLAPDSSLAYQGTWHDGTHIIPTVDADDLNDAATDVDDKPTTMPSSTNQPQPTKARKPEDDDDHDDHDDNDDDDNRGKGGHGGHDDDDGGGKNKGEGKQRRWLGRGRWRAIVMRGQDEDDNPFFTPKFDSDDEGFVDTPVYAQFNFTGSAVYVFALIPLFPAATNNTPTFVNLTYTLDSQPAGSFTHSGTQSPVSSSPSPSAFEHSVPVFVKTGLPEGFHALTINVGPDSVFLLDYITYSQDDDFQNNNNDTDNAVSTTWSAPVPSGTLTGPSGQSGAGSNGSSSTDSKQHNIATFAGAVGGSVGLLAVLAMSLALSLYRRRRAAARRDRRLRATRSEVASISESFHTDASEDGPPMQGPAPFVPRYFPGTVPVAPPPYVPSSSPEPTTSLLSSTSPVHTPFASVSWNTYRPVPTSDPGDASYADRPPPTPPPPGDDDYFAPPSFDVAISTPVPAILARFSGTPVSSQQQPLLQVTHPSDNPTPSDSQPTPATPHSRRASLSSISQLDGNAPSRASPPRRQGVVSTRSSRSSMQTGAMTSVSPATLISRPLIHTVHSNGGSNAASDLPSDRPPSSASEVPPSIPPPIEVLEAEERQDWQARHLGTSGSRS
ncbi:hypothetical protein K474DRAFT_1709220 [Panus rudis PR-1116 ss-1]|nr:hypothetical protein K474DRAFT_1709220 [Panus rudis PR-1116 ss-1]